MLQSTGSQRVGHSLATEQPPTHPHAVIYLPSRSFECYVPGTFTVRKYRDKHGTREGNGKVMKKRSLLYILGHAWRCVLVSVTPSRPACAIPWTVAHQALPMGFSRQECWSELPLPSPGDLPDPGIEPGSPILQADSYRLSHREVRVEVRGRYTRETQSWEVVSTKEGTGALQGWLGTRDSEG